MYLTKLTAIAECWDTYACTRSQKVSALFLVQSLCHCKVGFLHCPKQMWQHSSLRSACNLSCHLLHALPLGPCRPAFWCRLKPAQHVVKQDSRLLHMNMC